MDDVSGLADKSDEVAFFILFHVNMVLHVFTFFIQFIQPDKVGWWLCLKQKYLFFSESVQASWILRILSSFANRYKNTFIAHRNIWINRLYFEISNSQEKQCLTVDTCDVNALGPGKFRTHADNGTRQICYYNRNKTDTSFNLFLATREQTSQASEIRFSVVKVIDSFNEGNILYSEATN